MRPADLPDRAHFQALPCGTRAKYVAGGCRCLRCRAANSRYETERLRARARGEWNGLVPADAARAHLHWLSRRGVGRRAVHDACDVAHSILAKIKAGHRRQIRAETARRILAVTPAAVSGGARVPAGPTWVKVRRLLAEGFTKAALARRLGYQTPALQLSRTRITAATAARVDRLYRLVMAGDDDAAIDDEKTRGDQG